MGGEPAARSIRGVNSPGKEARRQGGKEARKARKAKKAKKARRREGGEGGGREGGEGDSSYRLERELTLAEGRRVRYVL